MKSGSPKKAVKVTPPSKKNPNFMRESDDKSQKTNPMSPLSKKRLSK